MPRDFLGVPIRPHGPNTMGMRWLARVLGEPLRAETVEGLHGLIADRLVKSGFRLPVRDDVESVTYHRPPTAGELRFGHGATHYRDFTPEDCCHPGTRVLKRWFVADDGLRYYR